MKGLQVPFRCLNFSLRTNSLTSHPCVWCHIRAYDQSSDVEFSIRSLATRTDCKPTKPRACVLFSYVSKPVVERCSSALWNKELEDYFDSLASSKFLSQAESVKQLLSTMDEMEPKATNVERVDFEKCAEEIELCKSDGGEISTEHEVSVHEKSHDDKTCVCIKEVPIVIEPPSSSNEEDDEESLCREDDTKSTENKLCEMPHVAKVSNVEENEVTVDERSNMSVQVCFDEIPDRVQNTSSIDVTAIRNEESNVTDAQKQFDNASVVLLEVDQSPPENSKGTVIENELEGLGNLFSEDSPLISPSLVQSDQRVVCDQPEGKKSKKQKKRKSSSVCVPRPNYFLGVPVSNPEIHRRVLGLQEKMLSSEAALFPYLIDVATLHLTLFVFHLNEEDLSVAKACMAKLEAELASGDVKPSIRLNFRNLGDFKNRVVFVSVLEDESYEQLVALRSTALQVFEEGGVVVQEEAGSWQPHLTVAKITYARKSTGSKSIRKIPASAYAQHKEEEFGEEHVSAVQLLSMTRQKDSRRYYQCESAVHLRPDEEGDHSACCFPRRPARPTVREEETASSAVEDEAMESLDDSNPTPTALPATESPLSANTESPAAAQDQKLTSGSATSKAQHDG